jgi:hypothetical protein
MKVALAVVAALAMAAPSYAKPKKKMLGGGDTCGTATGIICTGCPGDQSINYTDTGTTTGAANDNSSVPMACNGGSNPNFTGVGGPDVVYVFTANAPNGTTNLTITVTPIMPDITYDPAIYVLASCSTCRAKRDENGTGQPETIPAGVFYPAGSHYIFVDSALSPPNTAASGNYRIDVTGFVPVELMKLEIE